MRTDPLQVKCRISSGWLCGLVAAAWICGCQEDSSALQAALLELSEPELTSGSRLEDVTEEGLSAAIALYWERYSTTSPVDPVDPGDVLDVLTGSLADAPAGGSKPPIEPEGRFVPVWLEGQMVRFYLDEIVDLDASALRPGWFWMVEQGRDVVLCDFAPGRCGSCASDRGAAWVYCP